MAVLKFIVHVPSGKTLYDVLKDQGFLKSAYCGGRGICKKCRVSLNGKSVLACLEEGPFEGEVSFQEEDLVHPGNAFPDIEFEIAEDACGAAVDIGTTTIEVAFYDLSTGKFLKSIQMLNPQVVYGSDVLARVFHAEKHYEKERDLLIEAVSFLLRCSPLKLKRVVVVSNPVMHHFMLNLPVSVFGKYPFKPYTLDDVSVRGTELGVDLSEVEIYFPPLVGGFIGSDFLSGVSTVINDDEFVYVDMGTNAEIGLIGSCMICTSVPAGPAFEGVGMFSGMRASPGAIDNVWFDGKSIVFSVIGGIDPVGICASGYFDFISVLRMLGIVDKDGLIVDTSAISKRYVRHIGRGKAVVLRDTGDCIVALTQEDVRKFQVAKAALFGAVFSIVDAAGFSPGKFVLGGAMGKGISNVGLFGVRIFPYRPASIRRGGNLSVYGAARMLGSLKSRSLVCGLSRDFQILNLPGNRVFEEAYFDGMEF